MEWMKEYSGGGDYSGFSYTGISEGTGEISGCGRGGKNMDCHGTGMLQQIAGHTGKDSPAFGREK